MSMISPSSRLPFRTIVLGAAITALSAGGAGVTARAHKVAAASHERGFSTADHAVTPELAAHAQVRQRYGNLPLSFEANHGQSDSTVKFLSRGSGYSLLLTSNEAVLVLNQSEADESWNASRVASRAVRAKHRKSAVVRMTLVNANPRPQAAGHDELPGKSNYFIGNDSAKWRTNISTYAKVKYEDVYSGVDLVYYGNQGQLEYDFVVAPGADPRLVTLAFEGARDVHIDARGELVLGVEGGEVRQHKPVVYQEVAGVKQWVAGRYVMKGKRQVGFRVAAYDPSRPLIIDPVLVYSTYLGGGSTDLGFNIAVDGAGSAYVTGDTVSDDFPTTAGAAQTTPAGVNAFVTKLDATGSRLVYSTYLGGSGQNFGRGIAVDAAGSAYVTGVTEATDFPTTAGAAQTTHAGGVNDAFVTKLNATGSGLVYSTYLGGGDGDVGQGIAVGGAGSAYVAGETDSTNFPTTAGALQTTYAGGINDAFVTKLNATGSALAYSTYLGGSDTDTASGIAVDGVGSAYVTGSTRSTDFPTTLVAFQTTYAGGDTDTFVTKLDATGSGLVYSTYLGGSAGDASFDIAVDGASSTYVTGYTLSTNFPTTAGAAQTTHAGGHFDAFATKLDATGAGLVFSTYLGGNNSDAGQGIAVDGAGSAYVVGYTASPDFPATAGAFPPTPASIFDPFISKLDATGSRLVLSTNLGGSSQDFGYGIAVDSAGSAYVTGWTSSTDFPTTSGAVQTTPVDRVNAFVAKIATLPTSKDECKNGGWKTFGVFKNQGDCVSFVASKGKNPPSGS